MELKSCFLICFCSDRNTLTKSQFSELLSKFSGLQIEYNSFERALQERGIVGFIRRGPIPSKKVILHLGLYALPPAAQVKLALSDLRRMSPKISGKNADSIGRIKNFAMKNYSFSISMRVESAGKENFGLTDFSQIPTSSNKILSLMEKLKLGELPIKECVAFRFQEEKTKLHGGLALPLQLPLEKKLLARTGDTSIRGFELFFEKSPIGLKEVSFSLREKKLKTRVIALQFLPISKEILKRVHDHCYRIINLFLELEQMGIEEHV